MTDNGRFVADVTIPDDTIIQPGATFVKTWRVQNNGNTVWGAGYTLAFVNGTAMTSNTVAPLPTTAPWAQIDLSVTLQAPTVPGTYFGDWRLRDANGTPFGNVVYLRIVVPQPTAQPPATPPRGTSNSKYLADVTIPDGTRLLAGQNFIKTWRLQNNGERSWGTGYSLVYVSGVAMTSQTSQPVPTVANGREADLSILLTAPTQPGSYTGKWRLQDDAGQKFGDLLYLQINVVPQITTSWPFEPAKWRPTIWAITSVYESGRPSGDPSAYQTYDAGVISYGKHQATLASGNLNRVLQAYFQRSSSAVSQSLKNEYATRVAQLDASLRNDGRLKELLLQAAQEPAMNDAQDAVFDQNFYQPAITQAQANRITSPLGLACIYDTLIQGGLSQILPIVKQQLGGLIGDTGSNGVVINEAAWIAAFLNEREARLLRLADRAAAQGNTANANALRISTFRTQEYRRLLQGNNLTLESPLSIRGQTVQGIVFSL